MKLVLEIAGLLHSLPLIFFVLLSLSAAGSTIALRKIVQWIFSPTSQKLASTERRTRIGFTVIQFLTIPVTVFLVATLDTTWLKLREERRIAGERVQVAGGWDSIRGDAHSLTNLWGDSRHFRWVRKSTDPLPAAIASLNPILVECFEDPEVAMPVVYIHVTGLKSTDDSWPRYGFLIACGTPPPGYAPIAPIQWPHCKLITNSVYEVY